jgi:hypothetical protein
MSWIQVCCVRASSIVCLFAFLLGTREKSRGTRSAIHCPWRHLSLCQSKIRYVRHWWPHHWLRQPRISNTLLLGLGEEGLSDCVLCNHNHLIRSAEHFFWISMILNPPSSLGHRPLPRQSDNAPLKPFSALPHELPLHFINLIDCSSRNVNWHL